MHLSAFRGARPLAPLALALVALVPLALVPLALVPFVPPLAAQTGYREPPAPIAQILDAEPLPAALPSPDRKWLLLLERRALPAIAEVAAPELRLAGERIDPRTSAQARGTTYRGLLLRATDPAAREAERRIRVPEDARIADVAWSPDGARIAFTVEGERELALWVADAAAGQARRLGEVRLGGAAGDPCEWMPSSDALLCRTIPASRGAEPARATVPAGPIVQESMGRVAPNRTYQDLLQDASDEALFEHHFTSQLALVRLDGRATPVGTPGIHVTAEPSPDGRYLLVETIHRPYSYLVPMRLFPSRLAVWGVDGTVVREIAEVPLQEEMGTAFDAVPTGPRNASWRADAPATLVWVEALDDGDPRQAADKRDRLLAVDAPFTAAPRALLEVDARLRAVRWVPGARAAALVDDYWWRTRRTRTWVVDPSGASAPRLLWDRSSEDRYGDPGRVLTVANAQGRPVALATPDGRSIYLAGQGASPQGEMPFLDRLELATGKATRLWRSAAPHYEEVVAVLDPEARRIVTRRESIAEVPNYWARDLRARRAPARLTSFADPAPQFAGVAPRLLTYTRPDGVQLSATLYLPPGYDSARGPLPFLFWAYPREFKSAAAAAQVTGSPYRFVRPTGASHLFLLTQGYGILDGPSMPIVGEGNAEPNDSYVEQLVSSARAAVEKVVAMGLADRDRIGIGGHSYGAFMTANLLAHSDLFRAGLARSGAYNRTLTPFGFQQEERPYWRAREIYTRMSPFTYADQVDEPILLIHGMADDNSGTFPIQSERFYAALKGNGATVRYVQLPAEAHGYRARESVGHALWEMVTWMDSWVKSAKPRKAAN